jgi:hypothetical protein
MAQPMGKGVDEGKVASHAGNMHRAVRGMSQ